MNIITFIVDHGFEIIGAASAVLAALYALFLIIPGDQPDKTIKAVLDVTEKLSLKPKDK